MPDPIRTAQALPPSLLDDEHVTENHPSLPSLGLAARPASARTRAGLPLPRDPFGRDGSGSSVSIRRLEVRSGWSVEPLAKYLKGVATQIETNLRDGCLPSAERLEVFVQKLVLHTKKQLKNAPRQDRRNLQVLISDRFQTFWDFTRNQKVGPTSPEELRSVIVTLVENLS